MVCSICKRTLPPEEACFELAKIDKLEGGREVEVVIHICDKCFFSKGLEIFLNKYFEGIDQTDQTSLN